MSGLSYNTNTQLSIRLFHVALGLALFAAGYRHFQGLKVPDAFFYLILALGAGATVYHTWRALQLMGYMS